MLVTVEGIDGSGKTTVCEALAQEFSEAVMTREPTDTWYGQAVQRSIDQDDANPLAELFLYTADHANHLASTIRPALADGKCVISDRYSDSRYAYQGATLAGEFDDALGFIRSIHEPWTRPPDLTLYLDVSVETALERSDQANKFERAEALEHVRDNYERLVADEPERFFRIDAERPESGVIDSVLEVLSQRLETS